MRGLRVRVPRRFARAFRFRGARRTALEIAPIRRRLLASLINGALSISAIGLLMGLLMWRAKDGERTLERWADRLQPWRWLLNLIGYGYSVATTLRGSLGYRVAGIRLADARTGGPISPRQACIRVAVPPAWGLLVRPITHGRFQRASAQNQQQLRALEPELQAINDKHADDPEARQRALAALYAKHDVNPFKGCLPALLASLALQLARGAPALRSPLNQGLSDRLAGTVVVTDR